MKCPKDAKLELREREFRCNLEMDGSLAKGKFKHAYTGLVCTRPKNHRGKHHAHNPDKECVYIWTTTEAVIEAL